MKTQRKRSASVKVSAVPAEEIVEVTEIYEDPVPEPKRSSDPQRPQPASRQEPRRNQTRSQSAGSRNVHSNHANPPLRKPQKSHVMFVGPMIPEQVLGTNDPTQLT